MNTFLSANINVHAAIPIINERFLNAFALSSALAILLSPIAIPTITAAALATPIIITVESCCITPAMEFAATGSPAEYVICPKIAACADVAKDHISSFMTTGVPFFITSPAKSLLCLNISLILNFNLLSITST